MWKDAAESQELEQWTHKEHREDLGLISLEKRCVRKDLTEIIEGLEEGDKILIGGEKM